MLVADPIHEAPIAGVAVRFYAAPDGRRELPWHSFSDLCAAAKLPREVRGDLLRNARSHTDVGVATLPDGTVIESHEAAVALIGAMIEVGAVPASFAEAYSAAGIAALEAMHADLSDADVFERLKSMARTTYGVELVLPQ